MALRLSKPELTPAPSAGAGTAELPARATSLLAAGDLAGYRALFAEAAQEPDVHRRYHARRELLVAGLSAPRSSLKEFAHLFIAVATEGLAVLAEEPREPTLLNHVGVALYELGALAGARALFEAAQRLDPQLPHVAGNLAEIKRRRRDGSVPRLPAGLSGALRSLENDAKRLAVRAKPAAGLTLSLCMIVRDEETMLPRCLGAVADHVDEIIVVDTGSTDRTIDIAREFGATVIETEWTGDFAAARNVSFDAATSDWIVYLDADEVLMEGQGAALRKLTGHTWREAFFLVETNHTGDIDDGTSVHHNALRMFRNRAEYRFEGRIHEQIAHKLPGFIPERVETTDVRMEHFGYLGVVREEKDKSRRNLELLQRQLDENGEGPFLHFNLGSEYGALGENDRALEHFRKGWEGVLEEGSPRAFGFAPSLAARLAAALRVNRFHDELVDHAASVLEVFPGFTDLVYEIGLSHMARAEHADAERAFRQCLEMGDAPSVYSATVGLGTHAAHAALGDALRHQGDLAGAEAELRRALELNPRFLGPVETLAEVLLARGTTADETAATIHGLVAEDTPGLRFLLAVSLYEAGAAEAAERELRVVVQRQPAAAAARVALAEALLSQRRYDEAAEVASSVDVGSPVASGAARSELFARLAAGQGGAELEAGFDRARAVLDADALVVFESWRELAAGGTPTPALTTAAAEFLLNVYEALLRVQDVDPFVALLPLAERLPLAPRARRERMAQMYWRRGFLDSAADEWAAACDESGPDADALAGLAAVAVLRDNAQDAQLFAQAAQELDPGHEGAARVLARIGLEAA